MAGPPLYPEVPVPTWKDFCADYVESFFDGSRPHEGGSFIIEHQGRPVGHISYDCRHLTPGQAELDIWMCDVSCCGKGFGNSAINALCNYLHSTIGVREVIMRPSARNLRAVAAYKRAGFRVLNLPSVEVANRYGPSEYDDTVIMQRLLDERTNAAVEGP
jgi:diamine N-acetyltransferase